jgi:hypothetical protein
VSLSRGLQQLLFITGICRHLVIGRARHVVTPGDQRPVQRFD